MDHLTSEEHVNKDVNKDEYIFHHNKMPCNIRTAMTAKNSL